MDTNDFLGSFAQENVSFTTRVIRSATVGDNFWKVMIFVESDRFVDASTSDWVAVPGTSGIKALTVSVDDYAGYTSGVLQSWLYDLFCNGFTGDCILVSCGNHSSAEEPSSDEFIAALEEAYEMLKPYAYHKTVCAAPKLGLDAPFVIDTDVAVSLATLCATDKGLLSSAPYFPFTTSTPETPASDALYMALKNANKDAFMSAHQDTTRNAALYSLGIALGTTNGSGTPVGNSMDMVATNMITCSGPSGLNLSKGTRTILKNINVQTFKPVGNNTGDVSALGASTILGDVVQATWIVAYVTYMTKVRVAELITQSNFLKNSDSYTSILNVLRNQLMKFGSSGSGRLKELSITAPGFGAIESEADEIVIDDAWTARYVDQVRSVRISGSLYIGG